MMASASTNVGMHVGDPIRWDGAEASGKQKKEMEPLIAGS
jgi:hypothetical protein